MSKPDLTLHRNRRRRGNTMMEIMFFILPTFAIIFGFVDIGFALFMWNTLQNAVREGCRYAITYQVDSSGTQTQSIKNEVAKWSMNFVQAASTSTTGANTPYVQVKYYVPPSTAVPAGTVVTGANSNASGNVVEVSIQNYPYKWMAPFSGALTGGFYRAPGSTLTLAVYSTDVLGGAPVGGLPSP